MMVILFFLFSTFSLYSLYRNDKSNGGTFSDFGVNLYLTFVGIDNDVVCYLHTESCTLSYWLCGNVFVEQLLLYLLRNTGTVISNLYGQLPAFIYG
jgi:hypothetical protein